MGTLFDRIESAERNSDRTDKELQARGVSALRRAVISLLLGHCDLKITRDTISLTITLTEASEWIREFAPGAAGLAADKSNIRRALLSWEKDGFLAVDRVGVGREQQLVIVLFRNDFDNWLDRVADATDLTRLMWWDRQARQSPIPSRADSVTDRDPSRPTVTDRDPSRPTVTDRDPSRPTVTDRDPSRPTVTDRDRPIELNEEEESILVLDSIQEPDLPETLPGWVWTLKDEQELRANLIHWADADPQPRFELLVGLILYCRRKRNPANYYFRSRLKPGPNHAEVGREWLARAATKTADPHDQRRLELSEQEAEFGEIANALTDSEWRDLLPMVVQRFYRNANDFRSQTRSFVLKALAKNIHPPATSESAVLAKTEGEGT